MKCRACPLTGLSSPCPHETGREVDDCGQGYAPLLPRPGVVLDQSSWGVHARPSLARMVGSASTALVDVARDGFAEVCPEVLAAREATCAACPHRDPSDRCRLCGCFLAIKRKYAAFSCPDGRWERPAADPLDPDVHLARLATCEACPDMRAGRCGEGGLPIGEATASPLSACPRGRWA